MICFLQAFLALCALVAVSAAAPNPPTPSYAPAPVYPDVQPNYAYNYAVQDGDSGVDLEQTESRNGYATTGQYRVALPDGRIQTVTYSVTDGNSGTIAEVTYQGEAQYPEDKPSYAPAPRYQA